MTTQQFDTSRWGIDTKVIHNNKEYDVLSVDFEDRKIGLDMKRMTEDCEHCGRCEPLIEWVSYTEAIISQETIPQFEGTQEALDKITIIQ